MCVFVYFSTFFAKLALLDEMIRNWAAVHCHLQSALGCLGDGMSIRFFTAVAERVNGYLIYINISD